MCWQRHDQLDWSAEERWQPPPRTDLRVSDADRQVVVDNLRRHTTEGRLTLEEFEERVDEALRARTDAELRVAMRELPSSPSRERAGLRLPVRPGLIAACVVALLVVAGHWWVLIPAAFFVFGGCGHHTSHLPASRREHRSDAATYV